ncbi:hypothetical protein AGMMS49521_0810 [Campylobacterota bacterium]|nr:hypothetical protein AGMMS49521_0810 [Campylobacterota bacterium]GHV04352.1 hypothetical protein AGMMS50229_05560 [Campylobacterota bacterium]
MEFSQDYKISTPIHHLVLSEKITAVIDNDSNIRFINRETGKQSGIKTFNQKVEYSYFRGNSSSKDGRFVCLYFPSIIKTVLLEYVTEKGDYVEKDPLDWSVAATEVSVFSNDGSLLAIGGNDGQVCIYRTDNSKLITIPPRLNEYISAISFNKDTSIIAYASFKKTLTIYDLSRFTIMCGYSYKEVICCTQFLHHTSLLLVGARDNKIFLFDTIGGFVARELITTIGWPIALYVDSEDQFCFVSDKSGYLYLIDLSVLELTTEPIFNSKEVIVDIKQRGEAIYFAFESGRVTVLDLGDQREKFFQTIKDHNVQAMCEMMAANPILKFSATGLLGDFETDFAIHFPKAVMMIAQGKSDLAKNEMGDLLNYTVYKKRFDALVKHASKVITYWQLIQSGQYFEAYNMANEGEFYRKLPLFELLENRFKERFKDAIRNLNGATPDPKKVKEDLRLFSKVSTKDLVIKNLFRSPEIFNKALNAYEKSDWAALAGLIDKFKMIKGSPMVLDYEAIVKKEEDKFLSLMNAGRFEEAKGPATFLRENAKNDLVALKIEFDRLDKVEKFEEVVKNKQYTLAMQAAVEYPFLISSKPYKELDQMLSIRFKAAHLYATKNNFEAVDKMLRPFLKNKFSSNRAIGIYKMLYIEQINLLGAKMQQQHWINTLKNYVCRFGVDSELEFMAKKYNAEKYLEPFREFSNANFLHHPLIANIVTTPFSRPAKKPA